MGGLCAGSPFPPRALWQATWVKRETRKVRPPFLAVLAAAAAAVIGTATAGGVPVNTAQQLIEAVNSAQPGDVITLAPGIYDIDQNLRCDTAGTAQNPIVVRGPNDQSARIRFDAVEGFKVLAPHWRFEYLDIQGVCASDSSCEHALHIVGAANFTQVRHSRLHDYNAMIKGNGEDNGGGTEWPDDVLIEFNEFFNADIRQTSNPVTPIDVVGGQRWVIRGNTIYDFAKGQGNQISYAAFLKGNSADGLFERNLVICERFHTGGVRLGLSFGGGGSGPDPICEQGTCTPEHRNGIMRNNVIANCPADVGIYLNEAQDVRILHNTLYDNTGIDVRFDASVAELRYNVLSGRIRERDGGTANATDNREQVSTAEFSQWFESPANLNFAPVDGAPIVNAGAPLADVPDDYCGNPRSDGAPDSGALELGSTCADSPGPADLIFADAFE